MKIKRVILIVLLVVLALSAVASMASAQVDPGNKCVTAMGCAGGNPDSSSLSMSDTSFSWGMNASSFSWGMAQTGGR